MDSAHFENESIARILAMLHEKPSKSIIIELGNQLSALSSLERILIASGNAQTLFDSISYTDSDLNLLLRLLAYSPAISDILAQNPEFVTLLTQAPGKLETTSLIEEGERLLSYAHSTDHKNDRLRLIKQKWFTYFAGQELLGESAEFGSSLLAESLVELNHRIIWQNLVRDKGVGEKPCFGWVAFGKLAGFELNISSDIDLVAVCENDATDEDFGHSQRAAASMGRSMMQPMGRGTLYRVDQALRPFGGKGPLVNRWSAIQTYYKNYCESWEIFALLRSRGLGILAEPWAGLRKTICFEHPKGFWRLEEVLRQRRRTEEVFGDNDIKRGPGGIRDIEFLAYGLQMVYGHKYPSLQPILATRPLLQELAELDLITHESSTLAIENYTFMRRLEHAIQWKALQQTHELPILSEDWSDKASWVDQSLNGEEFKRKVARIREQNREIYSDFERSVCGGEATKPIAQTDAQIYLANLPGGDAYGLPNSSSTEALARFETLLLKAPFLTKKLYEFPNIVELIYSGEILEEIPEFGEMRPENLRQWIIHCLSRQQLLGTKIELQPIQRQIRSALADHFCEPGLHLLGLGSIVSNGWTIGSDCDIVFWTNEEPKIAEIQRMNLKVQVWMDKLSDLCSVDLRLRPEGRNGPIIRSRQAFTTYSTNQMEWWEFMAYSGAAPIPSSDHEGQELRNEILSKKTLDAEAFGEIEAMRNRIIAERIKPGKERENLKLGPGGLNSLSWILQLYTLKNQTQPEDFPVTIAQEVWQQFFLQIRTALKLLDLPNENFPTVPGELELFSKVMEFKSPEQLSEQYFQFQAASAEWVSQNLVKIKSDLK